MQAIKVLCFFLQIVAVVHSASIFDYLYGFPRIGLCRCGLSGGSFGTRTGRVPNEPSILPHEYPWLAAICIGSTVLAGSLISDKHVLTAAAPIYGLTPNHMTVTLGAHDRCVAGGSTLNVSVETITIHPSYSQNSQENNIALIKLKHAIAYSQYISPICLPMFGYFGAWDSEGITYTAGWAQTNSCSPHVAVSPSIPTASCQNNIDNKINGYDKGCLRVKNVLCKSDVGAPVMARWSSNTALRLIGVISTSSCNETSPSPPLYTRVVDHVGWIYEYIRKDCLCL